MGSGTGAVRETPLVVVDAANVLGSVPDGWWRDRRAAVLRLRDALDGLCAEGLAGATPDWARRPPIEVVLVVEGKARGIESSETVRVVSAPAVGDDTVVEVVRRESASRRCLVITADRGLRARVEELGAQVTGPAVLLDRRRGGPREFD
jgi:hypothetical protein